MLISACTLDFLVSTIYNQITLQKQLHIFFTMPLDKAFLKKVGHFGTYADADMKPQINKEWIKNTIVDVLGVALGTKPVSLYPIIDWKKYKNENKEELQNILRKNKVKYLSLQSITGKKANAAVYFKANNIKKAVLLALKSWGAPDERLGNYSHYMIGKFLGYPDKDIEAYSYFDVLPENWTKLSEAKQNKIWNTPETKQEIKTLHDEFMKSKKQESLKIKSLLSSQYLNDALLKFKDSVKSV